MKPLAGFEPLNFNWRKNKRFSPGIERVRNESRPPQKIKNLMRDALAEVSPLVQRIFQMRLPWRLLTPGRSTTGWM
jgi:hypothetical protein